MHIARAEDPSLAPSTVLGGAQLPVTLAPGDLKPLVTVAPALIRMFTHICK